MEIENEFIFFFSYQVTGLRCRQTKFESLQFKLHLFFNNMLARKDEVEMEVRAEDQKKINEFGKLNTQKGEFQLDFVIANKAFSQLEAAEEEIMLADGDGDDAAK